MKLSALGIAILLVTGPVVVADELDDTYQNLRDAAAKKDAAQVKTLAVKVVRPDGQGDCRSRAHQRNRKEDWPNRITTSKKIKGTPNMRCMPRPSSPSLQPWWT